MGLGGVSGIMDLTKIECIILQFHPPLHDLSNVSCYEKLPAPLARTKTTYSSHASTTKSKCPLSETVGKFIYVFYPFIVIDSHIQLGCHLPANGFVAAEMTNKVFCSEKLRK